MKWFGRPAKKELQSKHMKQFLKRFSQVIVVSFLLFTFFPYFLPVETKELKTDTKPYANSNFVVLNKTKFHYLVWQPDTGKINHKVLVIHGFSASTFSYRNNIEALIKTGALVIAVDLPAFGFSDKSVVADYSLENVFSFLNYLTDKYHSICDEKYTLIGHSMGAAISGSYASNFPEKIKSVVLIDGTPVQNNGSSFLSYFLKYPPLLRWADVAVKNVFSKRERFADLLSSAYSSSADSASVNGYRQPFLYKNSGSAIFRLAAANTNVKLNKEVLQKLPLYVIWGSNDRWLSIKLMRSFLQQYLNAKGHIIKDAGHCPMETHATEVNRVLEGIIK